MKEDEVFEMGEGVRVLWDGDGDDFKVGFLILGYND